MNFFSNKNPKQIQNILSDLIIQQGWDNKYKEMILPEVWRQITSDNIFKNSAILRFDKGKLVIKVESSTWRYELKIRKESLITKMNEVLETEFIKDITFI